MNLKPITEMHQNAAPWLWQLTGHRAATLAAQATPRWLHVEDGCVWVTAEDAGPYAPDLWLGAGDSLELPPGSAWVLQAWPQARMSLLAQPALKPVSASAAPAVQGPAPRAWWQSSWFWPWVLPASPDRHRPAMA